MLAQKEPLHHPRHLFNIAGFQQYHIIPIAFVPVGAHIRLRGTHSVAVTGTDSTGFTVIQANADGLNCKVTTGSYTYADLVTGGKSISVNR